MPGVNAFGMRQVPTQRAKSYYNYENLYEPDEPFHETKENARFFHVYNDEAESFDRELTEQSFDILNNLLVFAALFSAVVTTFVAQTSSSLSTDNAQVTVNLLLEIAALQRAGDNVTARAAVPPAATSTSPSNNDIWVNGLWFASLFLSLTTALFAVLAQQWLRHYVALTTGSPRERAFIRHFRWEGLEKWGVQRIIALLPTLLHASVFLFLAGLVVFMFPLDAVIARVVLGLSSILGALYSASILLPILYIQCPYRTLFAFFLRWVVTQVGYWVTRAIGHHHGRPSRPDDGYRSLERTAAVEAFSDTADLTAHRVLRLVIWLISTSSDSSAKGIGVRALSQCNTHVLSPDEKTTMIPKDIEHFQLSTPTEDEAKRLVSELAARASITMSRSAIIARSDVRSPLSFTFTSKELALRVCALILCHAPVRITFPAPPNNGGNEVEEETVEFVLHEQPRFFCLPAKCYLDPACQLPAKTWGDLRLWIPGKECCLPPIADFEAFIARAQRPRPDNEETHSWQRHDHPEHYHQLITFEEWITFKLKESALLETRGVR